MSKLFTLSRKLDDKIIAVLQASYLWLLDRIGVFVATVSLILFAVSMLFIDWMNIGWVIAILGPIVLINLLLLGQQYWLQGSGMNEAFNAKAMSYIGMRQCRAFFATQIMLYMVLYLLTMDKTAIQMAILLVYNYMPCIMIRDREKRPLWERKEEAVMEGA